MTTERRRSRSLPGDTDDEMLEGTVTIAFADLVGSTRLVREIGDEAYMTVINEIGAIVRDLAAPYRGLVPRHEGDGWMVVFGSARQALRWAIDLQRALVPVADRIEGAEVAARIGLHTGESLQSGKDFQGRHVNYAARIAGTAEGWQIHVSTLTWRIAEGSPEFDFADPLFYELPGFDELAPVYELSWRTSRSAADTSG